MLFPLSKAIGARRQLVHIFSAIQHVLGECAGRSLEMRKGKWVSWRRRLVSIDQTRNISIIRAQRHVQFLDPMQALNAAVEYSTSNMDAGCGIYTVLSIRFKAGIAVLGPGNAQVIGIE